MPGLSDSANNGTDTKQNTKEKENQFPKNAENKLDNKGDADTIMSNIKKRKEEEEATMKNLERQSVRLQFQSHTEIKNSAEEQKSQGKNTTETPGGSNPSSEETRVVRRPSFSAEKFQQSQAAQEEKRNPYDWGQSRKTEKKEWNSLKMVQEVATKKLQEQRERVYGTKESVEKELIDKLAALESEKQKYGDIGKTDVVASIEKKIESYKKTSELISAWKLGESDIQKLHVFMEKDIENLAPEAKIKQYGLVAHKLDLFNQKKDLKEEKKEVADDIKKLKTAKSVVDKAMENIVIDVKQNTVALESEIGQLMARWGEWDTEKAKELQWRVEEYKRFKDEVEKMNEGEKKGLVMFLQNDEQKTKFIEEENKKVSKEELIAMAAWMIAQWKVSVDSLRETGTNLVRSHAYSLFSEFWALKNSIPGLGNLKATDDIDEAVANIRGYELTEEDKEKVEALKLVQANINNFSQIQKDILSEVNRSAFLEQRDLLRSELATDKQQLEEELAKIAESDLSEEGKKRKKEELMTQAEVKKNELTQKLKMFTEWSDVLTGLEWKDILTAEELEKLGTNTDILALTNGDKYSSMLLALAKEWIDGRKVWANVEVQAGQLMDTSLLPHLEKTLSGIRWDIHSNIFDDAKTSIKEFKDVFVWKQWETALEREERFKAMDAYISSSGNGIVGSILLFVYRMFELVVNSAEKLPAVLIKSKDVIERSRMIIFVCVALFIFVLVVLFTGWDANNFVELNTKLFSMANYALESNGNLRYTDDTVQSIAQRWTLLAFLMALVVLYQIIIEIMNRYINFLRAGEWKGQVESFMVSILKWALFIAFVWFVFKIFV